MTQVLQRTVLFADLRGSTSMYETLGNADATAVVTRSVALLARVVAAHDGHVVKTLGDGLMAVFETPSASVADVSGATGRPAISALRVAPASAIRTAPPRAVNAAPNGPISTQAANGSFPTSVLAVANARRSIAPDGTSP